MKQIIANENGKQDILEEVGGQIYLTVNTQYSMSPWFKKCLKSAFSNIRFGERMNIDVGVMFRVVNVYLYTR